MFSTIPRTFGTIGGDNGSRFSELTTIRLNYYHHHRHVYSDNPFLATYDGDFIYGASYDQKMFTGIFLDAPSIEPIKHPRVCSQYIRINNNLIKI